MIPLYAGVEVEEVIAELLNESEKNACLLFTCVDIMVIIFRREQVSLLSP
jgi:hypothetical protein